MDLRVIANAALNDTRRLHCGHYSLLPAYANRLSIPGPQR